MDGAVLVRPAEPRPDRVAARRGTHRSVLERKWGRPPHGVAAVARGRLSV